MKIGPITASLWALTAFLQFLLLALMLRRRIYTRFPLFFTLALVTASGTMVLQLLSFLEWRTAYYDFYWPNRGIQLILGIAVIHEILRNVLGEYEQLRSLAITVFWGALALLLAGAALAAANVPANAWTDTLTRTLALGERSLVFIQAGLMLILFVLVGIAGLPWRRLAFGLAAGFGIYACVKLALSTAYSYMGLDFYGNYIVASMTAGIVKLGFWIAYVVLPESAPAPVTPAISTDLDRWNSALQEVLHR